MTRCKVSQLRGSKAYQVGLELPKGLLISQGAWMSCCFKTVCVHEFEQRDSARPSGLVALLNVDDLEHQAVRLFANANLIVPSTVLCEVDYMATKYLGERIARAFLQGQSRGEWQLLAFDAVDLEKANAIRARYDDIPLGFVDSSLIALAERYRISKILTLDRRHFWTVKSQNFDHFELLP